MSIDRILMPRRLGAAAKAALIGQFSVTCVVPCVECIDVGIDPDCPECQGEGKYPEPVTIPWVTIKEIYKEAVGAVGSEPGMVKRVSPHGELHYYLLNGKQVGVAHEQEHGHKAVEVADELFEQIAQALNVTVLSETMP